MTKTDDFAKVCREEVFTTMHCGFNRIPIESFKIRNSSGMHLGRNFLAAIFSVIVYPTVTEKVPGGSEDLKKQQKYTTMVSKT